MEKLPISADDLKRFELGNIRNTSDSFDSLGKTKVDSLKASLFEIEEMVKERQNLSESFIKEADKMKRDINNFLLENAPKGEDDSEFTRERAELRKKQIDINELQLNEKVGCWRDIALLKREFREQAQELNEKQSRSEALRSILEE